MVRIISASVGLLGLITITHGTASAQYSSLDTPVDPRSIAMGESFVAVRNNASALMYNPAGLAGFAGARASYAQRRFDWTVGLDAYKFHSVHASVHTPIANLGLMFNRFSRGEFVRTTSAGPEVGTFESYDYVVGIGAGHSFSGGVDLGVTIKAFDMIVNTISAPPGFPYDEVTSTPAILFDAGVLYSPDSLIPDHGFTIGLSLQNFGSNLKVNDPYLNQEISEQPVRFLKTGFSYSFVVLPDTKTDLTPFALLMTGEYRRILNESFQPKNRRDFWGFGVEVSLFELLSARLGGYLANIGLIYGSEGTPAVRYGFTVNVPMQEIGVPTPIIVMIGYGAIVLNPDITVTPRKSVLDSFSIGFEYGNEVF